MRRRRRITGLAKSVEELLKGSSFQYILFADLCGSTEYKQHLIDEGRSDSYWVLRQLFFLQCAADHIETAGGSVVKTLGDSILATFDHTESAEDIVCSCVDMIHRFASGKSFRGKDEIEVKVSLDHGETVNGSLFADGYDPVGLCVDRCARLNALAGRREIVFSAEFNKKLHIKEKTDIHSAITQCVRDQQDIKGLGPTTYYRLNLDFGPVS